MRITKRSATLLVALLCGCDQHLPLDSQPAANFSRAARQLQLVQVESPCDIPSSDAVIGKNGGTLTLGAHELLVPRNAVERPTRFTITCSQGENLILDFTAVEVPTGQQITQFARELQVKLSYAQLGLAPAEAQALVVVWLQDDVASGSLVPVRSVIRVREQAVIGWTDHFTRFAMGMN